MSTGRKVVVVGATGNVGTSVVEAHAADPSVDSITGVARRLPEWRAPKTRWVARDVSSAHSARDAIEAFLAGLRGSTGMPTPTLARSLPGGRVEELRTGVGQRP